MGSAEEATDISKKIASVIPVPSVFIGGIQGVMLLKNSKMVTEYSESRGFFPSPDGLALSRLKRFGSRIRDSKSAIGRATNQIRSRVIESRMKLAQHR